MSALAGAVRAHAHRIAAVIIVVALYVLSRPPALPAAERATMASRFSFVRLPLAEPEGLPKKTIRQVHPSLRHHAGWISTVAAGVALSDLDGDGLPNDVIHVDPRFDRVIVAPAPGTPERYAPFTLDPPAENAAAVAPMGCFGGDFNEDGLADVLVYYWGRTPVAFLRREPGAPGAVLAAASFRALDVAPGGAIWNTNAATSADLDGDGHLDLVIGNYFQDEARILDPHAPKTDAEQMQDSMSRAFNAGVNRVLLWRSGTGGPEPTLGYEDVEGVFDENVARGWTLALGAADLDGDGLPELYFANDFGPDRMLHNRSTPGQPRFAVLGGRKTINVPNSKVLGRDSFKGMGVDFGDLNGDGRFDVYVSNIADEFALQESHFAWVSTGPASLMHDGVAPYVDRSEALGLSRSGWGWESRLADFDNDGVLEAVQATGFLKGDADRWPELHELALGNDTLVHEAWAWPAFGVGDDLSGHERNPFWVRADGGRYFDLSPELGIDGEHVTRGIATADVDGDGDLEFVIANQWEPSYLYRNDAPAGHAFLGLNLLLPVAGQAWTPSVRAGHPEPGARARHAVGAIVRVRPGGDRELIGLVDGGNGHSGARSHQVHVGLGPRDAAKPVAVEIRWRDPAGAMRTTALELAPGWHTVRLGGEVAP